MREKALGLEKIAYEATKDVYSKTKSQTSRKEGGCVVIALEQGHQSLLNTFQVPASARRWQVRMGCLSPERWVPFSKYVARLHHVTPMNRAVTHRQSTPM